MKPIFFSTQHKMWGRRCLFSESNFGLHFFEHSKEIGGLKFFEDFFFFEWSDESLRSMVTWISVCLTFSPPNLKLFVKKNLVLDTNVTGSGIFKLPDVLNLGEVFILAMAKQLGDTS